MQANNEMQPEEIQNSAPTPEVSQASNDGMISKADMEKIIQDRIKKSRQREAEQEKEAAALRKQIENLQKKFESGKATSSESEEYMTAVNTNTQGKQQGLSQEDIDAEVDKRIKVMKLNKSIVDAQEKDKELNTLLKDPDSLKKISPEEKDLLCEYDNGAAIFKHLLTDDRDRLVYKATLQAAVNGDGGKSYYEFLGNLSRKLESSAIYPHPSNYKPSPNLNDTGDTEEFSTESYIRKNYR